MKKSSHKKSAPAQKKRPMIHGLAQFWVGFIAAAALGLLLVSVFKDQVFDLVVQFIGA